MRHPNLLVAAVLLISPLFAAPAHAWSNKEHIQLTRIAAARLLASAETPEAMKAWLKQAAPDVRDMEAERTYFMNARVGQFPRGVDGLCFWATVPDLHANTEQGKKLEPFGVAERLLHYIDLEYFVADEARRVYADDLSNKPNLADVPRDMKDWRYARAGMLPFRVEQSYAALVQAIRDGRLDDRPGQFPRDEHAAKWAGFLAHYVQDNTQPQHATVDFKSQTYFDNGRKAPNVHADVEYRLVDDEFEDYPAIREKLWASFVKALEDVKDPGRSGDLWVSTLEVSFASYDALPLIGKAARAAYPEGDPTKFDAAAFAQTTGTFGGREMTLLDMKANQLALGVRRVEKLWLQAWNEASAK